MAKRRKKIEDNEIEVLDPNEEETQEPEIPSPAEVADIEILPPEDDSEELNEPTPIPKPKGKSTRGKELVPYDPLRAYLRDIRAHPRLSREEEYKLAVRYKEHGDVEAAYKLVVSNLRLVVMIAKEYERAARNLLDLIQEGNIGLMEAVKNFDPYRKVRFPSYAVWWIRAYIIRFVIANWRLVKIGTTQAQRKLFFNLQKEKERLEREGFFPAPKLLAERLDVKEREIIEMEQRLGSPDISVDAPLQDDDGSGATLHSVLAQPGASMEEALEKKEYWDLVKQGLAEFSEQLSDKELAIFQKRMVGEEKATLQDLAQEFNLSRERIRQIESKLEKRLKSFLLEKFGPAFQNLEIES
ncbi:MAG: RNA polymerase factor sigma-32 [Bdellovibrionales bacterium]|nr:RNA polymerase factor sigma-32 [Bdellovibrionales bacterium]